MKVKISNGRTITINDALVKEHDKHYGKLKTNDIEVFLIIENIDIDTATDEMLTLNKAVEKSLRDEITIALNVKQKDTQEQIFETAQKMTTE